MKESRRPAWVSYLAIFLINFFVTSEFWSLFVEMDDEAVTILGAVRLLRGELPYRDWDTRHTPGSYFLSALCFALTGPDAPWPRVLFSGISALTACLIWWLCRRFLARAPFPLRILPVVLFSTIGIPAFPILSYHWYGTLTVVVGCIAAVRWLDGGRRGPEVCGLALALGLWCLQSAALTLGMFFLLVWWRYRPPGGLKLIGCFLGGSILLWLPLLPYTGEILHESVFNIRRHLSFNYQPYSLAGVYTLMADMAGFGPNVKAWHVIALNDEILVQVAIYLSVYPVALIGVLSGEWRRRSGRSQSGDELPAWCLLIWLMVTRAQQSTLYISFHGPLLMLVLAQLLGRIRPGRWIAGLLIICETVGWGLRAGLRRDAFIYPVLTRAGTYYTNTEGKAAQMAKAALWLRDIPPDTLVLAWPFDTSFYTLFHLKNPIRPPVLQPILYGDEDYQMAIEALGRRRVPWILARDSKEMPEVHRRVLQLTQDYELVDEAGVLKLFRRKAGL